MVNFKKVAEKDSSINVSLSDQLLQEVPDKKSVILIAIQLALICVAPASLYSYEQFNKSQLIKAQVQTQGELDIEKTKLKKLKAELAKYNDQNLRHDEFTKKIDILKTLAEQRIVTIRVLDSMHSATVNFQTEDSNREFIFFNNVSINGRNISIDGSASSEGIINKFVQRLQNEPVYQSIQWEDVKSDRKSKIKKFRVTGQIFLKS